MVMGIGWSTWREALLRSKVQSSWSRFRAIAMKPSVAARVLAGANNSWVYGESVMNSRSTSLVRLTHPGLRRESRTTLVVKDWYSSRSLFISTRQHLLGHQLGPVLGCMLGILVPACLKVFFGKLAFLLRGVVKLWVPTITANQLICSNVAGDSTDPCKAWRVQSAGRGCRGRTRTRATRTRRIKQQTWPLRVRFSHRVWPFMGGTIVGMT